MKQLTWKRFAVAAAMASLPSAAVKSAEASSHPAAASPAPLVGYPCQPCPPAPLTMPIPGGPGDPTSPLVAPMTPGLVPPQAAPTMPEGAAATPGAESPASSEASEAHTKGTLGILAGGASTSVSSASVNAAGVNVPGNFRNVTTVTVDSTPQPLILPGLFTAAQTQPVAPANRVFFDFGYFNGFAIPTPTGGTQSGFNLNRFNLGVEKTLFDNMASVYFQLPLLYATNNISGQEIDGLGDIIAGLKVALLRNDETGSMLSAGLTIAAPTGDRTVVSSTTTATVRQLSGSSPQDNVTSLAQVQDLRELSRRTITIDSTSTSFNPTYIQPWIGGLLVSDRFFLSEYFGVVIPTDDRVSTFLNNELTLGYDIYRACGDQFVTSVTPYISAQALIPVRLRGGPSNAPTQRQITVLDTLTDEQVREAVRAELPTQEPIVSLVDQVFLSGGFQIGIRQQAQLSTSVVVPVVGPKGFEIGYTIGLNYFY